MDVFFGHLCFEVLDGLGFGSGGASNIFAIFFSVLAFLLLCISGCSDRIVLPGEVLKIVSPSEAVVTTPPEAVRDGIRLNQRYFPREEGFEAKQRAFYTKYIDADGIAILSHAEVEDRHLIEARQVILTMTAKHPALRDRLKVQHGFYMILFEPTTGPENMKNIPELYNEREGYYYEKSMCRMTSSRWGDAGVNGFCTAAVAGEHLGRMNTFTHEFAHALDSEMQYLKDRALLASGIPLNEAYNLNREFDDRLQQAFQQAKASDAYRNLWDPYIITENPQEYWAEGVEIWYYGIGAGREFETHEAFAAVDPLLYELLSEWFYKGSFPRTPIPSVPQYNLMWESVRQDPSP